MEKPTKRTIIAKKLVDIYMSMEEDEMTEIQKVIKQDIEYRKIDKESRHNYRLEYFTKRIDNINNTFTKKEHIIAKKPNLTMPKPVFNMFEYNDDELIKFLMAYIEKMESNRKTKYNSNDKIDIDDDYTTAIEIINSIADIKYENLEDIDNTHYNEKLSLLWKSISPQNVCLYRDNFKYDYPSNKNSILNELLKSYYNNTNIPKRLVSATNFNFLLMSLINDRTIHSDYCMDSIIKYRIIWTLFIRVIYQNFQYLCEQGIINSKNFTIIIEKLTDLVTKIEDTKDAKNTKKVEKNLYDGFYKYNYCLRARAIVDMELICIHTIHKNEYTFIKEEDLFLNESGNLKEEYKDIENIELDKLNKLFNSGKNMVNKNTFNNSIKHCKEFIPIYNDLAGRNLKLNNISTLRAVYRTLFVNRVNYNRQNSYTISKKIIEVHYKIKKSPKEHTDTMSDIKTTLESQKNEARNIDKTIFEDNFILGSSISNEVMLERPNGYNILCYKYDFMCIFNKLSLLIFYKFCPRMGVHCKELKDAYKSIKYYFEQVMTILYCTS